MPIFVNPGQLGDVAARGLSHGAGTDAIVFAASLASDPLTLRRSADAVTVQDETILCLKNIEATLREAGMTLKNVVKTTCFISSDEHRFNFIEGYKQAFGNGPYPARVTFVMGLAADHRVQIEAVAVRSAGSINT